MNLHMQYASRWGITGFGGEFRNEGILSNVLGKPMEEPIGKYRFSDNRTHISYYLEHNLIIDRFSLSLGGLLNHFTTLPNKFNLYPAVNASYRPTRSLRVYASWNKATRVPTFTDLYYTTATHIGNSNLEAETSESFEVGAKLSRRVVNGSISAFYMKGSNMIDWVKANPDDKWESRNHTRVNKRGFEANARIDLDEWFGPRQPFLSLNLGYMHLHQNRVEDDWISNYTLNHLRHKFTAALHHRVVKDLTLSWNFRWQERAGSYVQYVDLQPGEQVNFTPFGLLDLKANWSLGRYNLFVNANNIFNATHGTMAISPAGVLAHGRALHI